MRKVQFYFFGVGLGCAHLQPRYFFLNFIFLQHAINKSSFGDPENFGGWQSKGNAICHFFGILESWAPGQHPLDHDHAECCISYFV